MTPATRLNLVSANLARNCFHAAAGVHPIHRAPFVRPVTLCKMEDAILVKYLCRIATYVLINPHALIVSIRMMLVQTINAHRVRHHSFTLHSFALMTRIVSQRTKAQPISFIAHFVTRTIILSWIITKNASAKKVFMLVTRAAIKSVVMDEFL